MQLKTCCRGYFIWSKITFHKRTRYWNLLLRRCIICIEYFDIELLRTGIAAGEKIVYSIIFSNRTLRTNLQYALCCDRESAIYNKSRNLFMPNKMPAAALECFYYQYVYGAFAKENFLNYLCFSSNDTATNVYIV